MELVTIPVAARELGIAQGVIRRAVRHNVLPAYRIGKRWLRLDRAELEQWVRDSQIITIELPIGEDPRQLKLIHDGS